MDTSKNSNGTKGKVDFSKGTLHYGDFKERYQEFLLQIKDEVTIVSPFITRQGCAFLKQNLSGVAAKTIVVECNYRNFLDRTTDLDALEEMMPEFNIELMPNLHAKFIIADRTKILMGSANITGAGIGTYSNYRNEEMINVGEIDSEKGQAVREHFKGKQLDRPTFEKLKNEFEKAVSSYQRRMKDSRTIEDFRAIVKEFKEDAVTGWIGIQNVSAKRAFVQELANFDGKELRNEKVKGCRDTFRYADAVVKVKEACRSSKDSNKYGYSIGLSTINAFKRKQIHCTMLVLKDENGDIEKAPFFTVPRSELKYFTHQTKFGTSHFDVVKEGDRWFLKSKFYKPKRRRSSRKGFELKMDLADFMGKSPDEMKGKRHRDARYRFDGKKEALKEYFQNFN